MNQTFDYTRFCHTLKHNFTLNIGKVLTFIGIELGTILAIVILQNYAVYKWGYTESMTDPAWSLMNGFFWIGLFCGSIFFASLCFKQLRKKTSATSFLMLPSSQFEKYLSNLLLYVISPLVIFLLGFEVLDLVRWGFFSILYPHCQYIHLMPPSYVFGNNFESLSIAIGLLVFVQSTFVLGSAIWPRNSLGRTFLALFVLFFAFIIWCYIIFLIFHQGINFSISFDDDPSVTVFLCCACALAIFNYVIAYYRLKEAEIINHL